MAGYEQAAACQKCCQLDSSSFRLCGASGPDFLSANRICGPFSAQSPSRRKPLLSASSHHLNLVRECGRRAFLRRSPVGLNHGFCEPLLAEDGAEGKRQPRFGGNSINQQNIFRLRRFKAHLAPPRSSLVHFPNPQSSSSRRQGLDRYWRGIILHWRKPGECLPVFSKSKARTRCG
jgi:hypothetical protein